VQRIDVTRRETMAVDRGRGHRLDRMRSDHRALLFLGAVATLGGGVRFVRSVSSGVDSADAAALRRQLQAADSAKGAEAARARARAANAKGNRAAKRAPAKNSARSSAGASSGQTISHRDASGRLDLDVANLAEIDSLPGIGPTLARRIIIERAERGPFVQLAALTRVKGLSKRQIARLDTLVTFSGRSLPVTPADTAAPKRKRR
jgi:competence protein ComEA